MRTIVRKFNLSMFLHFLNQSANHSPKWHQNAQKHRHPVHCILFLCVENNLLHVKAYFTFQRHKSVP